MPKLYPDSRKVTVHGIELSLTAHEYDLLYLFIKNPEKVYSREMLYDLVWHGGYYGENNTVNVHVSNLRKKIKEADPSKDVYFFKDFEEIANFVYNNAEEGD